MPYTLEVSSDIAMSLGPTGLIYTRTVDIRPQKWELADSRSEILAFTNNSEAQTSPLRRLQISKPGS